MRAFYYVIMTLIIKVDSDDILLPERMMKQINLMKSNPSFAISGTNASLFKSYK